MEVEKFSKKCTVKDQEICEFLGSDGCESCTLFKNNVRKYEKAKTNEIWQVTKQNLPSNIDVFHDSKTCLFCKERPGQEGVAYAMIDIAHPEPHTEQGHAFGLGVKMRMPVGSLLQLPVTICKECRRRFNIVENLKYIAVSLAFVLSILVMILIQDTEYMQYSPEYIPIVSILLIMALAYWLSGVYARRLIKKYSAKQYFRLFEIPEAGELNEKGWFILEDDKDKSRMYFSRSKPRRNFRFLKPEEVEMKVEQNRLRAEEEAEKKALSSEEA